LKDKLDLLGLLVPQYRGCYVVKYYRMQWFTLKETGVVERLRGLALDAYLRILRVW